MSSLSFIFTQCFLKEKKYLFSFFSVLCLVTFLEGELLAEECKFKVTPIKRVNENTFATHISNQHSSTSGVIGGSFDDFLSGRTQRHYTSRLGALVPTYKDSATYLKFGPNDDGLSIGAQAVEADSLGLEPDPDYLRLPVVDMLGNKYFAPITRAMQYASIRGQNNNATLLLGNFSQYTPGYYRTHTFIAKTSTNYQIEDLTPYVDRSEVYAINNRDSVVGKSFGDYYDPYDYDEDGMLFLYREDQWGMIGAEHLSPPQGIKEKTLQAAALNDDNIVVARGSSTEDSISYNHLILWANGNRVTGESIFKVRSDTMSLHPTAINKKGEIVGFDPTREQGFYFYNREMSVLDDVFCPNSEIPANASIVHVANINERGQILATMKGDWRYGSSRWDYSVVLLTKVVAG